MNDNALNNASFTEDGRSIKKTLFGAKHEDIVL
jgi:hypothetical protein